MPKKYKVLEEVTVNGVVHHVGEEFELEMSEEEVKDLIEDKKLEEVVA